MLIKRGVKAEFIGLTKDPDASDDADKDILNKSADQNNDSKFNNILTSDDNKKVSK